MKKSKFRTVIVQTGAYGVAQGTLSLMQGGSFHQALISGVGKFYFNGSSSGSYFRRNEPPEYLVLLQGL